MFFLSWILLIAAGLLASMGVFFWALRSGQFSDQERARYLPLSDRSSQPSVANPSKLSKEVYALLFALALGLAGMLGTVLLTFYHLRG